MQKVIKVAIFGPPLDNSGGIGTLFTYFRDQVDGQVEMTFIDTRGRFKNPFLSSFSLLRAFSTATLMAMGNKLDVSHINFGVRGSAFRKLPLSLWIKKALKIPVVLHLHASSFDTWMAQLPKTMRSLIVAAINCADEIIVLGDYWVGALANFGVNVEKVQVLVMGVPDLQPNKVALGPDSRKLEVLFAGEMSKRKGLPELLDAMADPRLFDVHLTVAGSGSIDFWKEKLSSTMAEERVDFLGHLPVDAVHKLLESADVLILPSRAEGLPVSVMEGMSSGSVIVSTAVGALGEHLISGKNSVVLTSQNPAEISDALVGLQDPKKRQLLAAEARETWRRSFNVEVTSTLLILEWAKLAKT